MKRLEPGEPGDHGTYIQLPQHPGRPPTPASLQNRQPKEKTTMHFHSDLSGAHVSPYIDGNLYCVTWQMQYDVFEKPNAPLEQTLKCYVLAHEISAAIERAKIDIDLTIEYEPRRVVEAQIVHVEYLGTSVHLASDVADELRK